MITTNVASSMQESAKGAPRMYREKRRSVEVSALASMPSILPVAVDDHKCISSSNPSQRFPASQNPEDIVASRYLQRLGNTLVRRQSQTVVEKAAPSSRASSFRLRGTCSRPTSALAASLAGIPAPLSAVSSAQPHVRSEAGTSATQRWRSQVPASKDNAASSSVTTLPNLNSLELVASSPVKAKNVATMHATPPHLLSAEGPYGLEGRSMSPKDTKRASNVQRRFADGNQNRGRSTISSTASTPSKTGGRRKSYNLDGQANRDDVHAPIMKREERSRLTGRGVSFPSQPCTPLPHRGNYGMSPVHNEAVERADSAVNEAAALMSGAPLPKRVRTDEERNAIVITQEHSKLMLLVGRRANLETDIEDALELADIYEKDNALPPHRPTTATLPISQSPTTGAAPPFPRRKRRSSTGSRADIDTAFSLESDAVRSRMRQLLTKLLNNASADSMGGGTNLDHENLTWLVQRLQAELDLVEEDVRDRLELSEDDDDGSQVGSITMFEETSRNRAISTLPNTAAPVRVPQSTAKLLLKRKIAEKRKQADLREVSSNQERMEWLMESVDAELLTDVQAERYTVDQAGSPSSNPFQLFAPPEIAEAVAELKALQQTMRNQHAPTDSFAATVPLLSPLPKEPASPVDTTSPSPRTRTMSQPSMVPFSLSGSVSEEVMTRTNSSPSKTRDKKESYDGQGSAPYGLNLLGFMVEILAQYNLDGETGRQHRKKRPLTAPSKNSSFTLHTLQYGDSFSTFPESNSLDGGENYDGKDAQRGAANKDGRPTSAEDGPDERYRRSPRHGSAGKRQQHFTGIMEYYNRNGRADGTLPSASTLATRANAINKVSIPLGAQLRNLRTGLLQDLHELCRLYDYMHLIDARRCELRATAGDKSNDEYEAELERKLAAHRQKQEAAQRARDDAQRRKAESADLEVFGQGGGGNQTRRAQEGASQSSARQRDSAASRPRTSEAVSDAAATKVTAPVRPPPPKARKGAAEVERFDSAAEEAAAPAAKEVETELMRERVEGGKLYFTLIGVSAPSRASSERKPEKETPKNAKKKRGGAGTSSGATESYLRYELRVERMDVGKTPSNSASDKVTAAPLVAVVKVNPRRLMNLKLNPASEALVETKKEVSRIATAVEIGAAPMTMLSLVPLKRYKASSFAKAFEFSASVEAAEAADDSRENSVASMPFAFPSPGNASSRSASLDSGTVLPVATAQSTQSEVMAAGFAAASITDSKEAEGEGRSKPCSAASDKRGAACASAADTGAKDSERWLEDGGTVLDKENQDGDLTDSKAEKEGMKPADLPPIRNKKTPTPVISHPPSPQLPSSAAQLPLPSKPPMQETQRSVEEWGVPHFHAEMEAVEKNAVVLTVLWAEEEELPWPKGSPPLKRSAPPSAASVRTEGAAGGLNDSALSPAEALLATIPDEESGRVGSAASRRPARGMSGSGSVAAEEGEGRLNSASAAVAVDAVASELIRQVMESEEGEGNAEWPLHGERGASLGATAAAGRVSSAPAASHPKQDAEALHQKASIAAPNSLTPPKSIEIPLQDTAETFRKEDSAAADRVPSSPFARPSSSPTAQKQMQPTPPPLFAGVSEWPGSLKSGELPCKSAEPPKMMIGVKAAPSLTITSTQSRPMCAEEAQSYGGGLFRLDITPEESDSVRGGDSATAAAVPQRTPRPTAEEAVCRGRVRRPATTTSSLPHQTDTTERQRSTAVTPTESAVPALPPVLLQQTAGSSKVHVLLPQEAVASSLGPRVHAITGAPETQPYRLASAKERVTSVPESPATAVGKLSATDSFKEQFSVLPKSGIAAEAAADPRTITHVQSFLQAVMRRPKSVGTSAAAERSTNSFGGAASQSDAARIKASTAGGMGALRSEVDQLQEEARQLFMMDPVRYDAVVSELIQKATEDLQREFSRDEMQHKNNDARAHESARPLSGAAISLLPVLVVKSSQDQAADTLRATVTQDSTNPLQSGNSDEAEKSHRSSHVSLANISSSIPHPQARHPIEPARRASKPFLVAGAFGGSATSLPGHSLTSLTNEQSQRPSVAFPPTAIKRRSTHTLVKQSDSRSRMNSYAAAQRRSCADAVAEVERILYEQMKAKLLLRAIIEKMRALWHAKQRSAEERNRNRITQNMRQVMNRALAAAWPIERQRVINLRKLIYILDRRLGRVHGWLPHYSDSNVLMTAPANTTTAGSRTMVSSQRTFLPLTGYYRGKDAMTRLGTEDESADGTSSDPCPRYMRYLPQCRMYHYVRLAKSRRMMPLQLVRSDIQECHSRHILLGYEKIPINEAEQESDVGPIHAGWPKRNLPVRARLANQHRYNYVPRRYEDMKTRGERERYRRRLQGTAAFQRVSKKFSPRTRQDVDLPFALH